MPYIISSIVIFPVILYLLALMGRRKHPGLEKLKGFLYAHRGFHRNGVPENSLAAFRLAVEKGFGSELDIHLMQDGNLAVIHDSSLMRTAGADVKIEELTATDLPNYTLEKSGEQIPLFKDVLDLYAGRAPLIVELKTSGNNYSQLCQAACDMLDSYAGAYCVESFDPRCIAWLKKHRPDIIRGQLAENFLSIKDTPAPWILRMALTCHLLNFLMRPDFIAYKFADRNRLGTILCRKLWGIQGVSWTLRRKEDLDQALKEGWLPIFEGFEP